MMPIKISIGKIEFDSITFEESKAIRLKKPKGFENKTGQEIIDSFFERAKFKKGDKVHVMIIKMPPGA